MKKVISHGLIGNHILLISKRHAFGFILRAVVFIVMTVKTHTQCKKNKSTLWRKVEGPRKKNNNKVLT